VLAVGYVVSARPIADRRIVLDGYRLADLERLFAERKGTLMGVASSSKNSS
jgi:hypothetical protein